MIFEDVNVGYLFLPVLVIAAIYAKVIKRDKGDPLRDKLKDMEIILIGYGAIIIIAALSLPGTPSLSTFGFPETLEDINSQKKVLFYLQRCNQAIVRTTEVVHWLLFISVIWVIATMHSLIRIMRLKRENKLSGKK